MLCVIGQLASGYNSGQRVESKKQLPRARADCVCTGHVVDNYPLQIIALVVQTRKNNKNVANYRFSIKISMPRIPAHLRERAIGMLNSGTPTEQVAAHVGSSVQAVRSLRRRFTQTGSTADLPRSGRPRVTTRAQDRYILSQHLRNRFLPATVTAAVTPGTHNPRISAQTVRNRLAEDGLYGRRPYVGPVLTAVHR